jgi:ubiquinone/menaquinone biosynthesis C-methylase UbiE
MTKWTERLDRLLYPQIETGQWDDALLRERVLRVLSPAHRLLDLGAGAGIVEQTRFRGLCAEAVGIDLDERVLSNPHLDAAKVASAEQIPYPDASFDVVVCDNVLEHLEHPAIVLREVARVLRPGGSFLAKTPNRNHYMPTIARATPHAFHQFYNRLRGRATADTFPTRYRANTRAAIERLSLDAGLRVESITIVEGRPEYLRITVPTYLAGYAYERMVNSSPLFERFRIVMFVHLRK